MEVQLIEKVLTPAVIPEVHHQPASYKPDPLDTLMDAVSREIRNRLVTNISAYCDCV